MPDVTETDTMTRLRRLPSTLPLRRSNHRGRRRGGEEAVQVAAATPRRDHAAQRVRDAGGPLDRACYTCGCGLWFQAPVSTSVTCPHCGAGQAW